MPKQLYNVEISIHGKLVTTMQINAETAEGAEDLAAENIKLSAFKAYKKGEEDEQETETNEQSEQAEPGSLPEGTDK